MWGAVISWLLGNKWVFGIVAGILVLLVLGIFKCQSAEIDRLEKVNAAQALDLIKVTAINQGQAAVITELEKARKLDSEAILYRDGVIHGLNEKLAAQRRQIAEGGQSDPEHRHWAVQPVSALADGLLRGGSASGGAHGTYPADPACGVVATLPAARLEWRY